MAVYHVSLKRLTEARARLAPPATPRSEPANETSRINDEPNAIHQSIESNVTAEKVAPKSVCDMGATGSLLPVSKTGHTRAGKPPVAPEKVLSRASHTSSKTKRKSARRKTTRAKKAAKPVGRSTAGDTASLQPSVAGVSDPVADIEGLLRLPRVQVGELLASCNEPTRKVMLALIYRVAALEDELRGLSSKVRSTGARALQTVTTRPITPPAAADGKDDLLEQVFQKNVSLRKGQER